VIDVRPALTPAENRVVAMLAEGFGQREIAAELHITLRTVRWHIEQARDRTGATNVAHLIYLWTRITEEPRHDPARH
jgi:DNA-binding CsgD family transcriptional regulator